MGPLEQIRGSVRAGRYWFTEHAIQQMARRGIERGEVEQALSGGRMIEEYPKDKYSPSCLVCGPVADGYLHVQVSLPPRVWIITTYRPDPQKWVDPYTRRRPE